MKNIKKFLYLLVAIVTISSCELDKVSNLQDSFVISVAAEPVGSKVAVAVFDAAEGTLIDSDISVTLSGANADDIFTISGSKNIKLDNGVVVLGVNKNVAVSAENPIVINATFKAEGYADRDRQIVFDGQDIREEQVSMLNESNLPETVVLVKEEQTLDNGATMEEIEVSITSNSNAEEVTEFNLPESTTFEDEDGNPISGTDLTADFQTFDSQVPEDGEQLGADQNPETFGGGNNDFPGGLSIEGGANNTAAKGMSDFYKLKSKNLVDSYLIPITSLGCYYLFVDGKRVYRFSSPALVRNYIYRNAVNPDTGLPVENGDEVSVFYYDRTTASHEELTKAIVQSDARGKYVEFEAPRAGVYPVGFLRSFNHSCTSISSVKFQNNGRRSFYFYAVVPESNPTRALRYGYMFFEGTYEVTNNNINNWQNSALNFLGENTRLVVYGYNFSTGSLAVVYNEAATICGLDGQTIDITNDQCFEERDLDLTIVCDNTRYTLPDTYISYREVGSPFFLYFDRSRGGKLQGKSPCLEDGKQYEFAFYYDEYRISPPVTQADIDNLGANFDIDAICNEIQ